MISRIVNALFKRVVAPFYVARRIRGEQIREERLVMVNVPLNAQSPLTDQEKSSVSHIYSAVSGGGQVAEL